MDSTVIVAIPSVDDKVWRVSSEKVPHLTLLFLGDAVEDSDFQAVVEYVQHAASQLSPFWLTVDYRGTLGPQDADVLFFEKRWEFNRIADFRHHLLLNDTIKKAYDSVEQFPEWTPHLTLGFPETPAKEDDSDYPGINSVNFDRIAVWSGNYEGPEFRLKYEDHVLEVAMSDISTAERGQQAVAELFHYGTKGMKWGVRKAEKSQRTANRYQKQADALRNRAERRSSRLGSASEMRKANKFQKRADAFQRQADRRFKKVDKKWEKSVYTVQGAVAVHNAMADHFNARIDALNNKHPDADIRKGEDTPEWKAYMSDIMKLEDESYSAAVTKVHGSSPSGRKEAVYTNDGKGEARIEIRDKDVKHAAEEASPDLVLVCKVDEQGRILEANHAELEVEHSGDAEAFLAHYGVKGMRWGIRKDESASKGGASSGPTAVVVTQKKPGTFAKAKGGQGHPMTDDARVALEARQKARASTTDALTNAELRKAVERMNLEKQYNQLQFESDRRSRGLRFVSGFFGKKRYNGEKRKFQDEFEEGGERTQKVAKEVAKVLAEKRKKS